MFIYTGSFTSQYRKEECTLSRLPFAKEKVGVSEKYVNTTSIFF